MADEIIIAHVGCPFMPPEIPAAGGVVVFAPDPLGSQLWLGEATQEQADFLTSFEIYTVYQGDKPVFDLATAVLPDKSWTREGIAEWALENIGLEVEMAKKDEMLLALNVAVADILAVPTTSL